MGRHRTRAARLPVVLLAVALTAGAVLVARAVISPHAVAAADSAAASTTRPASSAAAEPGSTAPSSTAPSSTALPAVLPATAEPSAASAKPSATNSAALTQLRRLVAQTSPSATSAAAYDLTDGESVQVGASRGMTTASVVKLQLLESLLLERQRAGRGLTEDEVETATAMIEHSDNEAAETIFWDVGGRSSVVALEKSLGLSRKVTVPGSDDYWGLTTTSAQQQIALLRNLVSDDSPLSAANRRLVLQLMRHVEDDQAWGVSAAASSGTSPAVKNGWLGVSDDGGLWAVNSVGIITVGGHTLLVAVFTQHGRDYESGIDRVEALARAAVAVVR
jgi:hypothetical protein